VQLLFKIYNLCVPDPPTDRQTDRQSDGQHAISIPCYALVHRAVKVELVSSLCPGVCGKRSRVSSNEVDVNVLCTNFVRSHAPH